MVVIMLLGMMVLPLPALALDMLFTFNISLSLIILMTTVYAVRPLDVAVFPSVLLLATLLRLALNVASTRVVLMNGHEGAGAAGRVIQAFGDFVVGGSYAIGLVVFVIFVIINFVVVTKGAGRVSEVNARFTLDAMPGKQMAIDADLNAGLIDQEEARARRQQVQQESEFYGAMDGASKFVRGDAVAGILILLINIVGGLAVGTLQQGLAVGEALRIYTLLTIGDGLVAQIPSLLLSTAAAILVTRVSSTQEMGRQIVSQLFSSARALGVTAAVIGLLGIIPGMPNLAFLLLAGVTGGAAWMLHRGSRKGGPDEAGGGEETAPLHPAAPADLSWDDVHPVDLIGLELGYRLIPLVDRSQGGDLMARIKGVRKKLSQELGFLIHPVHIRDNLELTPNAYRISILGVPVGEAEVQPELEMAINPGQVFGALPGIPGKDPAFGLDAVWIKAGEREQAQTLGYTVVDVSTVIATHLSTLILEHASDLLGHDEAQQLLNVLARQAPKLAEDLVPKTVSLAVVVKVLQTLLAERVPIRDMRTIAESLAEHAARSQDPVALTAAVRAALGRSIIQNINGLSQELDVITIKPELEQILLKSTQQGSDEGVGIEPGLAQRLLSSLKDLTDKREIAGEPSVLVVAPQLRAWLARWLRPSIRSLHVLGVNEIPDNKRVRIVASVG
ncbi:flagellar biosynthesis protein FlhA [Thioflavicoccus mobilis 8321]|uniref:Flagellar biosynthesis protein FlhA n=1 Tax=Thioflavicoccus mobilis 8321 TaxID=765912 RepID=L0GV25_9GAMM|nr:flagellar biosynthesis protein FlhA [Thioflavicoccus mobilis 8321]